MNRPPAGVRGDDLDTVAGRIRADLTSSAPSTSTVNGYLTTLGTNGRWNDVKYADTSRTGWSQQTHLTRLSHMARADVPRSTNAGTNTGTTARNHLSRLLHDGVGYVFAAPRSVTRRGAAQSGSWSALTTSHSPPTASWTSST